MKNSNSNMSPLNLTMVYTGNGKGKTTAAVGQGIRAWGHGYRVYMIHFMKGRDYGEFLAAQNLPGFTVEKAGRDSFVKREDPDPVDVEMAQKGWERVCQVAREQEYDLLILDELNVALSFGLLQVEAVIDFLVNKNTNLGVIITGREAPEKILQIADLVSEIQEIKHHYQKGIMSHQGIEY